MPAAWSEDVAGSYLALGRVYDAVRTIGDVTRRGYAEGAEMLCELAGKLMRSGYEPQARLVWQQARAEALGWLTTGLELALRTGDPEGVVERCARCGRPGRARAVGRRNSAARGPGESTRER